MINVIYHKTISHHSHKMSVDDGFPIVNVDNHEFDQQIEYLRKKIADMEKQQAKDRSHIVLARINHRLCQKISNLEECLAEMRRENDALGQTVATLDEKVTALLVKVDKLENDSCVNDYLLNQRVDQWQDVIGELQGMVFPSYMTEYPQ